MENNGEISLDPNNWDEIRKLGYQSIDLMIEYLSNIEQNKVWKPIPPKTKEYFSSSIPLKPQSTNEIFDDFINNILPYPSGNIHPRFWGFVKGTGTPTGAIAELLATTMNSNTGGGEHIANYVELQIIEWAKEMLNFDKKASGLITSGCSMANLTGLAVARNVMSNNDIRKEGLRSMSQDFVIYGSDQIHSSIKKSIETLGIGSNNITLIPTNDKFEMDVENLEKTIQVDISNGKIPMAVVANAGTVNTGAIDPLNKIAEITKKYKIWYHIDGAFGALAKIVPEYDDIMFGLELADSIAFDMHKWMYMPYEIGLILVKDPIAHKLTFSLRPDYLSEETRGFSSFKNWATEYGIELSRGFRSLKAWFLIKEHGFKKYQLLIHQNIKQARYLGTLIEASDQLEILAPIALNIVCFRFIFSNKDDAINDSLNKEVLLRIQEEGIALFSSTILNNKYALRVAITNHRTKMSDIDLTISKILEIGNTLKK